MNLSNFSLLGGTSSTLRIFLGGTSEKTHPVGAHCKITMLSFNRPFLPLWFWWRTVLSTMCKPCVSDSNSQIWRFHNTKESQKHQIKYYWGFSFHKIGEETQELVALVAITQCLSSILRRTTTRATRVEDQMSNRERCCVLTDDWPLKRFKRFFGFVCLCFYI